MSFFGIRVFDVHHIFIPNIRMLLILTLKIYTKFLLTTYICPSIYGWSLVYIFNLVSIFSQSVVQNVLRNVVSPSKMMDLDMPKCTQTYYKNMFLSSCPVMVLLQGIQMHILLNMSTTKSNLSCPFLVVGWPPTKSWRCSLMVL